MNNRLPFLFLLLHLFLAGCSTTLNASDLIRDQRNAKSPQWNGDRFQNPERVPDVEWGPSLKMFWNYFFNKSEGFIPDHTLPSEPNGAKLSGFCTEISGALIIP